jgi:hypothetical protein
LRVIIAILIAVSLGCTDQGVVNVRFANHTNQVIDVIVLNPETGYEFVLQPGIEPGETTVTRSDLYPGDPCSDRGVLIARDQQGHELARRSGRFCKGDTWVVGDDHLGSSSPSG